MAVEERMDKGVPKLYQKQDLIKDVKVIISSLILIAIFVGTILFHIIRFITPPKKSCLPLKDQAIIDEMLYDRGDPNSY